MCFTPTAQTMDIQRYRSLLWREKGWPEGEPARNEVRESQVVSLWLDLLDPASSNLPLAGRPAFPERFAVD